MIKISEIITKLIILILISISQLGYAQDVLNPSAETIEKWYGQSIYCIWVQPVTPEPGLDVNKLSHGTAFLVHLRGYFLTASHVIKANGPGKLIRGKAGTCDKTGVSYLFTVVKTDEQVDLALLKIMDIPPAAGQWPVMTLQPGALDIGKDQPLVAFGYPPPEEGGTSPLTTQGGKITNYFAPGAKFRFNAPVAKGFSGGPVFGQNGYVVGITIDGRDDVEGFKGFVPSNFSRGLMTLLGYQ